MDNPREGRKSGKHGKEQMRQIENKQQDGRLIQTELCQLNKCECYKHLQLKGRDDQIGLKSKIQLYAASEEHIKYKDTVG